MSNRISQVNIDLSRRRKNDHSGVAMVTCNFAIIDLNVPYERVKLVPR